MSRVPFQVAVFPYRHHNHTSREYALLKRSKEGYWQSIAGGGENTETPLEAANRESFEEAHIPFEAEYLTLKTMTFVPVYHFKAQTIWPPDTFVVPIYYFGVNIANHQIVLSHEHSEYQWVNLNQGREDLQWDSDKTALWELDQHLKYIKSID